MRDAERVIGRLEEFKEWASKEFTEIKAEIRSLNRFKWKIAGGAAVVSGIVAAIIELVKGTKGG